MLLILSAHCHRLSPQRDPAAQNKGKYKSRYALLLLRNNRGAFSSPWASRGASRTPLQPIQWDRVTGANAIFGICSSGQQSCACRVVATSAFPLRTGFTTLIWSLCCCTPSTNQHSSLVVLQAESHCSHSGMWFQIKPKHGISTDTWRHGQCLISCPLVTGLSDSLDGIYIHMTFYISLGEYKQSLDLSFSKTS